ncbi:hypothetical protein HYH03_008407 [Edaphochlamys debaryana]|uniref:Uncharacterized protein n=1 Tax=Edaphochlamys debaryana TaxID=47281 RepID=A0A836BY71_9CHLO|nr:hypothetical protein HYH03_008407 [Edaphochlamys debaryana]|eukprot:KAG2493270.1 hypothetical protein HYH03_008407 [Edaphochlamys debaryana]
MAKEDVEAELQRVQREVDEAGGEIKETQRQLKALADQLRSASLSDAEATERVITEHLRMREERLWMWEEHLRMREKHLRKEKEQLLALLLCDLSRHSAVPAGHSPVPAGDRMTTGAGATGSTHAACPATLPEAAESSYGEGDEGGSSGAGSSDGCGHSFDGCGRSLDGDDGDEALRVAALESLFQQACMAALRRPEVYEAAGLQEPPTGFIPPTREELLDWFQPR